ncbi:MAG: PIN domain-containing protein [Solirubrobacteraceae bacterium]|nr:PIN domain-containing protein [Solirubrobacteraceae bacterium]
MERPFGGRRTLVDTSAYARIAAVPQIRQTWERGVAEGLVYLATPTYVEILDSARNGDTYTAMAEELDALPAAPVDEQIFELAVAAHARLASVSPSFHRNFSMPDLLVAAAAHRYEIGVWHYDRDFDHIREHTALEYDSIWAAPPGSIGAPTRRTPQRAARSSLSRAVAALPPGEVVPTVDELLEIVERRLRDHGVEPPGRVPSEPIA